jgi:hypothetical protein
VERGQPFGNEAWLKRAAAALGLLSTLRPGGGPRKGAGKGVTPFPVPFLCLSSLSFEFKFFGWIVH